MRENRTIDGTIVVRMTGRPAAYLGPHLPRVLATWHVARERPYVRDHYGATVVDVLYHGPSRAHAIDAYYREVSTW